MGRADGRVEKGQKIGAAFSARAWNRAQDAADIVFRGADTGGSAPLTYRLPSIQIPVYLQTPLPSALVAGYAFKLLSAGESTVWDAGYIDYVLGELAQPVDLIANETDSTIFPSVFGVSVEPAAQGARMVRCAIAGIAVAKIRMLSSSHRYVSLPTTRSSSASPQAGVLESSDTGYAVILNPSQGLIRL
jgi:hypothetical protein